MRPEGRCLESLFTVEVILIGHGCGHVLGNIEVSIFLCVVEVCHVFINDLLEDAVSIILADKFGIKDAGSVKYPAGYRHGTVNENHILVPCTLLYVGHGLVLSVFCGFKVVTSDGPECENLLDEFIVFGDGLYRLELRRCVSLDLGHGDSSGDDSELGVL